MEFKEIYRAAGIPGMILALASIGYMLAHYWLQHFTSLDVSSTAGMIVYNLLDLAKILLCIWLMKHFMESFLLQTGCSATDMRRMGTATALLSAATYAAASMAFYMWHPELVQEAIRLLEEGAAGKLDLNQRNTLEIFKNNFPRILFFSQLIYCFLYGWVLSVILAPRIMARHSADNE